MQNLLNIYRASAGAGKTFLLTASFLKLALQSPEYYRKILAVTFTNKAAEEMKNRITEEIHTISDSPEKSGHLKDILAEFPELHQEDMQIRAQAVQNEILHNYSLFSVSTIDSFVQKVIRAFTFEMNLQSNFTLQMDTDYVMADLRKRLYDKIGHDKKLTEWLIEFTRYKTEENRSRNFDAEIETLSREILKEEFQERDDSQISPEKLRKLEKKLHAQKKAFEGKMLNISQEAEKAFAALPFDYTKLGRDVKYMGEHLTKKLKEKNYEPNNTVQAKYDSPDEWPNKSTKAETRQQIASFARAAVPLLTSAMDLFFKEYPVYLSVKEVLSNFYSFGLLSDIAALLPDYRSDYNELLISDTTLLLKKLIENNDAPFIYEKTGSRYNHILIDEFQDTSGFQWHNFKPLITNSLASGHFNLLVGDIKQSIYSWRGGDRNLLMYKVKEQIGKSYITEHNLAFNWRSDRHIVALNNSLFKRIPKNFQEIYNAETKAQTGDINLESSELKLLFSAIEEAYRNHEQKIPPKTDNKGYACIEFVKKQKSSTAEEVENEIHERVGKHIQTILSRGYNAGKIALLVRTNSEAKKITNALYEYQEQNPEARSFQIVSQESAEISKAETIKILSAALRILNNPNDSVAEKELYLCYLNHRNKLPHDLHTILKKDSDAEAILPTEFIEQAETLKQLSLFELSERLIEIFGLRHKSEEFEFLRNFQDMIFQFSRKRSNDLNEFLIWWDEKGRKESLQISSLRDAVQVLTIHKSKGLGVAHLIIPYADWKLNPMPRSTYWGKDETGLFEGIKYFPINYKKAQADTVFRNSYHTYTLQTNIEMLNLLYVALTRAKNSLFICVPYKPESKKPQTVGDLLVAAVKQEQMSDEKGDEYTDTAAAFNSSEDRMELGHIPPSEEKATGKEQNTFKSYPGNNGKLKPEISYQSQDFFTESIDYIEERVNYGSLMHRILAGIKHPDDASTVLRDLHAQGYITKPESEKLFRKVQAILKRPTVAPWFEPGLEVISEKALITPEGLTRIPDRVIKKGRDIQVIDFKFGKERPEYIAQIQEYQSLLQEVYGQKVKGILYYAETDRTETV